MLANPELVEAEDEVEAEEGCLSVPDYSAKVKRARRVAVRGHNRHGQPGRGARRGAARARAPARDRPPRGDALHRPPQPVPPRDREEEAEEGPRRPRGRLSRCASSSSGRRSSPSPRSPRSRAATRSPSSSPSPTARRAAAASSPSRRSRTLARSLGLPGAPARAPRRGDDAPAASSAAGAEAAVVVAYGLKIPDWLLALPPARRGQRPRLAAAGLPRRRAGEPRDHQRRRRDRRDDDAARLADGRRADR